MLVGVEIIVNPSLEQVMCVVLGKTSSWESVPQGSGSQEEAVSVELTSHSWNMKGLWVACYYVNGMVCPNHEGLNWWDQGM